MISYKELSEAKWVISGTGIIYKVIDYDQQLGLKVRYQDGDYHYDMWISGGNLFHMHFKSIDFWMKVIKIGVE